MTSQWLWGSEWKRKVDFSISAQAVNVLKYKFTASSFNLNRSQNRLSKQLVNYMHSCDAAVWHSINSRSRWAKWSISEPGAAWTNNIYRVTISASVFASCQLIPFQYQSYLGVLVTVDDKRLLHANVKQEKSKRVLSKQFTLPPSEYAALDPLGITRQHSPNTLLRKIR